MKSTDFSMNYLDLKETIEKEKKFHLEGWGRIQKYYQIEDEKQRYNETKLKNPPYKSIGDVAKSFISLSFSTSEGLTKLNDTSDALLGVGTELLLKSIILKKNPEKFIKRVKQNKEDIIRTPPLKQCIQDVKDLLKNELDESQLERLDDVLTLINIRRNELVHLHFHKMGDYATPYQILNVLEFLFVSYFPKEREFIDQVTELKEKRRVRGSSMDFTSVEFPKLEGG